MVSLSPSRPILANVPSTSRSPPPGVTGTDAMPSPHHLQQPPLRAHLHALLQHSDSHHSPSSPAMSPSSDTPSHHHTTSSPPSSSTSVESVDHVASTSKPARSPLKPKQSRGAISIVPDTSVQSTSSTASAQPASPSLTMAALPRSVTTSRLDQPAARSQRSTSLSSAPSRTSSLDPSHFSTDAPVFAPTTEQAQKHHPSSSQIPQRPSIKVRIITWNMHDSIPKGDLEVLLGKAGQYVAPDPDWDVSYDSDQENGDEAAEPRKGRGAHVVGQEHIPRADRIPPLPHNDSHPYHLVVIAGQECPWGDGKRLATSVGMAGELGDFGKQKNRTAKEKEYPKDKSRPFKTKEKQKSGDSDNLPNVAEGSKTANSTTDEAPSSSQGKDSLTVLSDDQTFPFFSSSSSSALSGQPLASPMIGGTSMPGLNSAPDAQGDDKLVAWPNLGGKGWSDLCEDWLCRNQVAKKEKDHKEKSFISGTRLARALSQTASKRDFGLSRESLNDQQYSMPTHSFSASVTPELSRAASPVCMPTSTSVPGTPNQTSTFEGFNAFLDPSAQPAAEASASAVPAEKRKRLGPRLNLNTADLVRRTAASGRSSPANFTDAGYTSSPVLLSPTAVIPRSDSQPLLAAQSGTPGRPSEATAMPAVTGSGSLLAVPNAPAMSRMSSSQSLSELGLATQPATGSASPAPAQVHVEPPTPSLSPSPCPSTSLHAQNTGQALRDATPSPTPSAAISKTNEAGAHLQAPERAFSDAAPKALGPYELVIKERMMGCYMAVYVWRGCKDRVRGASRSHVKSGLLAGRVGNKGGVGISLKLGTTRLLFVNAHLAAHEDKVALRLANVAKIKAALKVDSFLPPNDPRSRLEDITEQFDHTFWFGDLNFRIDISRQHADWLMMNKKYDQALAFDQLHKVLKAGDAFKGFKEAPINFPPTYKYDVLKTLKIKKNKTLTSIRNAIDIPGATAASTHNSAISDLSSAPVGGSVILEEGTISVDADNETAAQARDVSQLSEVCGDFGPNALSVRDDSARFTSALAISPNTLGDTAELQDADRSDEDRYSIASSSAFGSIASSSGFARSLPSQEARLAQGIDPAMAREHELELQRQRELADNTNAAQGPRFFSQGAAIKAKFKLMDMVRSAANTNLKEKFSGAVATDSKHGGRKKWLNVLSDSPRSAVVSTSAASDSNANMESVGSGPSRAGESSICAPDADDSSSGTGKRASLLSIEGRVSSVGDGEASAVRSGWSSDGHNCSIKQESGASANAPVTAGSRRSSLQMATDKAHREAKYPHLTGATAEQIDYLEAQPYDTSAKQRVPSWCDRVLFRSTVALDPDDVDEQGESHKVCKTGSGSNEAGMGSRVGSALSQALIMPLRQAAERRHHMHGQRTSSTSLTAPVAGNSSIARTHDQPNPTEMGLNDSTTRRTSGVQRARARSSTTTSNLSHSVMSSLHSKAQTRTIQGGDRTRHPHLLERFLHPARRRQLKALSPSMTFSDLTQLPHHASASGRNASIDLVTSAGVESRNEVDRSGFQVRAISTVDLPSQVEQRDNRFDGLVGQQGASSREMQETVLVPHRHSLSPEQGVFANSTDKPLPVPVPMPRQRGREVGRKTHTKRSASLALVGATPEPASPTYSPSSTTRLTPAPVPAPADVRAGWIDSLSSHFPAFFSALRSNRQPCSSNDPPNVDTIQEQRIVGPKKGTIDCLLYKALDDREMRLLEGRSDHRPVVFVGAIGI